MSLAKFVNRTTHKINQLIQRKRRKKISRDHRKKNPTVPKRKRFEHKYNDILREIYNAMLVPAGESKQYKTTIKDFICRMKWDYWKDYTVTPKTMRNYIHKLEKHGLIKIIQKTGQWVMELLSEKLPKPSYLRGKFWDWMRCGRTFPFTIYNVFNKQCSTVVTKEILPKDPSSASKTSIRYNSAVADLRCGLPRLDITRASEIMDDFFVKTGRKEYQSAAEEYENMLMEEEERRRDGINTHREERGMELIPPDMPLSPPKNETRDDSRRYNSKVVQDNSPRPEPVKAKSEEEKKADIETYHNEGNRARGASTFDFIFKTILRGVKRD